MQEEVLEQVDRVGDVHHAVAALLLGDLHLSERRIRELVARAEW